MCSVIYSSREFSPPHANFGTSPTSRDSLEDKVSWIRKILVTLFIEINYVWSDVGTEKMIFKYKHSDFCPKLVVVTKCIVCMVHIDEV